MRAVISSIFLLFAVPVMSKLPVQFAGFAFLGDYEFVKDNFPHSLAINAVGKSGQPVLDGVLGAMLDGESFQHIELIRDHQLAELRSGDTIVMAFVADRETVSVEKIAGRYKVLIQLSAQALFFDFSTMVIVGSIPVMLDPLVDVRASYPTEQDIRALIEPMYLEDSEGNLFRQLITAVGSQKIKRYYKYRLQVAEVLVDERAVPHLPERYQQGGNFQNFVADSFARYLTANQRVSVLPFTKGHAIGQKMSARFSNGDIYNLTVPEADYEIEITVRGFKKVQFSQNDTGSAWIYGVYTNFKVWEPLSKTEYLDGRVKNAATKSVPASQEQEAVEDWPAFEAAMLVMFDRFTREIDKPSRSWVKKHMEKHAGDEGMIKQMLAFKEIVGKCT